MLEVIELFSGIGAQMVNSDCQLYKQAGNSIVVNVLAEIFTNLFKEE
jgi:site-specific DNA-cytosine methylase